MIEVGALQAKNTLGSLLDRVQNGEEIRITRRGKPVACLVPDVRELYMRKYDPKEVQAAMDRIRARAAEWPSEPFDWEQVKKDRDQGRP